jgi:general secretion pathway protein D
VDQNPTLTPTVSQRRVRSSVSVENGQTVMLAGLISDQTTTTKNGLPFLSNIQYIGDVIGNKDNNVQRTELLIFIRPQIITNGADAASVTEEFRNRMQSLRRVNAVNVKF